jgi:hypothetical protein
LDDVGQEPMASMCVSASIHSDIHAQRLFTGQYSFSPGGSLFGSTRYLPNTEWVAANIASPCFATRLNPGVEGQLS